MTDAEYAHLHRRLTHEELLSLARQIPAYIRARHPDYTDEQWIRAAGIVGTESGALSGVQCLLGWALGARGNTEVRKAFDGWSLFDTGYRPKTDGNGVVSWTDGSHSRRRFDAERVCPEVARSPDEATFLLSAAREVAANPHY